MSKRKSSFPDSRGLLGKQRLEELPADFDCSGGSDVLELSDLLPEGSISGEDPTDLASVDGVFVGSDVGDEDILHAFVAQQEQPLKGQLEDVEVELPFNPAELQTVKELDLSELSLSTAQARRLAPLLSANSALTVIHFDGHDLPVKELQEEEELEWDSEDFTDVEAIIIAEYLKDNASMKRLDLARNQIADEGAIAIALALCSNGTLEYLNLESNSVAERGGAALIEAVQTNSTLQYLNLAFNAIPTAGAQELRDVWTRERQGLQLGLHL